MARTKKTPLSDPSIVDESSAPKEGGRRLWPRLKWLLRATLALGVLAALPAIWFQLPDLRSRPEYRLKQSSLQFVPPPTGEVPEDLPQRVWEELSGGDALSVLDPATTARLAEILNRSPWIAKVQRIEAGYPSRIVARVQYRQPVAMVEVEQGLYPVDGEGMILPPPDFSLADAERFPKILGVTTRPRGAAGRLWPDLRVQAGARLAAVLAPYWRTLQLQAIRVLDPPTGIAATPDDFQLELLSPGGSRIAWGRPPGTQYPGELEPVQKLGRLQKYLSEFGTFDGPHSPYEIDIRHWQEITRRPVNSVNRNAQRGQRPRW